MGWQTFYKGLDCKYFRLWAKWSLLQLFNSFYVAQKSSERIRKRISQLCSNTTLFTKTDDRLNLACRCSLLMPARPTPIISSFSLFYLICSCYLWSFHLSPKMLLLSFCITSIFHLKSLC